MIDFVKPDASVVKRLEFYSILMRDIKITLLQLRKTKLMIRGLRISSLTYSDLDEVEMKLIHNLEEVNNSCKRLLHPLLGGFDFGHERLNHWGFSIADIKLGYCKLEEILEYNKNKPVRFGKRFILLLDDYKDPTFGSYAAGDLINIATASHFIDDIPPRKNVNKGLYQAIIQSMVMAMNYRNKLL